VQLRGCERAAVAFGEAKDLPQGIIVGAFGVFLAFTFAALTFAGLLSGKNH
jgi:hypothetical protein